MTRKKAIQVLIVDDHPLIVEAYKSALLQFAKLNTDYKFVIEEAYNSDESKEKVLASQNTTPIELVFLDIKIPPSSDRTILSGEDLGLFIKATIPSTKIIVSTMFNNNFRLNTILSTLNPDALLIKDDINSESLLYALEEVLNNTPYYSKTVLKLMRKKINNTYVLTHNDRLLLYHLSKGVRQKDLSKYIPLSSSSIERRKKQLKELFDIDDKSDSELIRVAEDKGFI